MRARLTVLSLATGALVSLSAIAQTAPPGAPIILKPPPGVTPIPAQAPPAAVPGAPAVAGAQRIRGVIQTFDGPFLTLKTTDKKIVTLGMTMATRIAHNRIAGFAGLAAGAYVSIAALLDKDKKLRAQGVRIYPENARGQGEGQYAVDAEGTRVLTNGVIAGFTPGGNGGALKVTFRGAVNSPEPCTGRADPSGQGCNGTAEFQIARGIPIIAIETGDINQLLPGATISASVSPDANGTLVAVALTIEKDTPPPKAH